MGVYFDKGRSKKPSLPEKMVVIENYLCLFLSLDLFTVNSKTIVLNSNQTIVRYESIHRIQSHFGQGDPGPS